MKERKLPWKSILIKIFLSICIILTIRLFYSFSSSNDFTKASKELYHAESHAKEKPVDEMTYEEKMARASKIQAQQHHQDFHNDFHLLFLFTKVKDHPNLLKKMKISLGSMFEHAHFDKHEVLHLHFVCDEEGREKAEDFLQQFISHPRFALKVHFHDVDFFISELKTKMARVQSVLGSSHPRYEDIIFLLSLSLHKILPLKINRIIQLDLDLKFTTNVKELWDNFNYFSRDHLMALAHENQPVYRHLLWKYRKENPGTLLGNPPPHGNPGYNSGVLLLHLHRMRMSDLYNSYLEPERLHQLLQKYSFTGHLGDQDFYTLLSFEQPQLFQTLDCSWNKQLCQWWKDKGYEGIFDQYFKCHQPHIKIWHANCDSQFPQ